MRINEFGDPVGGEGVSEDDWDDCSMCWMSEWYRQSWDTTTADAGDSKQEPQTQPATAGNEADAGNSLSRVGVGIGNAWGDHALEISEFRCVRSVCISFHS